MERWLLSQVTGKILTCADKQHGCTPVEFSRQVFTRKQWRRLWHLIPFSNVIADEPIAKAEIWQGAWVVKCPFCAGVEDGDPASPLFLCCSCWNALVSGRLLQVEYPAEHKRIEHLLLKRSEGKQRNWLATETADDIERENHTLDKGKR